jgi:predicted acylesterase/phospholipase RssA
MSSQSRALRNGKRHSSLVLGGGGARGEFQVGVVECLAAHGHEFDFFTGIGQGALNAVVLAQYPTLKQGAAALTALWNDAASSAAVYAMPAGGIALNALLALFAEAGVARDAVFGAEPLRKLIAEHVSWDQLAGSGKTVAFGTTSLSDGRYHVGANDPALLPNKRVLTFEPGHTRSIGDRFGELVLAAVSLPLLFPPVDLYGHRFVDSGARRPFPLELAAEHARSVGCDQTSVTAVSTSLEGLPLRSDAALRGGRDVVARLLEIVNHDALGSSGDPASSLWSLRPELDVPLGALDFDDRQHRGELRAHGWSVTERAIAHAATG